MEKPYLTKDQMKVRKKWCKFEQKRMKELNEDFYCCFLDEKWFYTTSRRGKVKVLSPEPGEDATAVASPPLTAVLRLHAIKVGVSAPIDCCVFLICRADWLLFHLFLIPGDVPRRRGQAHRIP